MKMNKMFEGHILIKWEKIMNFETDGMCSNDGNSFATKVNGSLLVGILDDFVSHRIVGSPSNGVSCEWFESETRQNIPLLNYATMENQAEVGFY